MFVRTASERDLEAVRQLLVETWHDTYDAIYGSDRVASINTEWHSLSALRARIDMPQSEFLLADDGETIAGVAFATAADDGKTVKLHQLNVHPAHQGRGIGGLLLDELEGCFPDADKVRLEVEEANMRAVRFYVGQGFSKVGETGNCGKEGSGIKAAIFERPILWAE